jgi:hypothetical protein
VRCRRTRTRMAAVRGTGGSVDTERIKARESL